MENKNYNGLILEGLTKILNGIQAMNDENAELLRLANLWREHAQSQEQELSKVSQQNEALEAKNSALEDQIKYLQECNDLLEGLNTELEEIVRGDKAPEQEAEDGQA